jgi:hypothetical protein
VFVPPFGNIQKLDVFRARFRTPHARPGASRYSTIQ